MAVNTRTGYGDIKIGIKNYNYRKVLQKGGGTVIVKIGNTK